MFKKILIFAFCICLLTSCADSSSTKDSSAVSSSSSSVSSSTDSSSSPEDDSLFQNMQYYKISGASIPIPSGYSTKEESETDTRSYEGPNGGKIHVMSEAFKIDISEASAKKKLDDLKDSDSWSYSDKKSNIIDLNNNPAFVISYHLKMNSNDKTQEIDESIIFFNSNNTTIRVSIQGDILKSGNFKKYCDLIEIPVERTAKEISFDDVNYVEVDDLMIPVPKDFKVESEKSFSGEKANIYYFSTVKTYDISEYGMNQEVEEIKKGYNEPDADMFQDNEVHSSKLDFIGGKMAYYISYTAKIKGSANDTNPTVVERIDIYLNSSEHGVRIMLSEDMTKESNFKAFCDKIKYK